MLSVFRSNTNNWLMIGVFIAITFVFVFTFGSWGGGNISGELPIAATVNGEVIPMSQFRVQYAQTARRWTRTSLSPFGIEDAQGRKTWRRLLLAIERDIVLANKGPGMIADDLADYLYARSTGHFASLMTLLARGCQRAIKSGQESLTAALLDTVPNDAASEQARRQLDASLRSGHLSTRRAAG